MKTNIFKNTPPFDKLNALLRMWKEQATNPSTKGESVAAEKALVARLGKLGWTVAEFEALVVAPAAHRFSGFNWPQDRGQGADMAAERRRRQAEQDAAEQVAEIRRREAAFARHQAGAANNTKVVQAMRFTCRTKMEREIAEAIVTKYGGLAGRATSKQVASTIVELAVNAGCVAEVTHRWKAARVAWALEVERTSAAFRAAL